MRSHYHPLFDRQVQCLKSIDHQTNDYQADHDLRQYLVMII